MSIKEQYEAIKAKRVSTSSVFAYVKSLVK